MTTSLIKLPVGKVPVQDVFNVVDGDHVSDGPRIDNL